MPTEPHNNDVSRPGQMHTQNTPEPDPDANEKLDERDMPFLSRYMVEPAPKTRIPKRTMAAKAARELIRDLRQLDLNPRVNLASYVNTSMEDEANEVIREAVNVNLVDAAQYRSCKSMEDRCVAMLGNLWHAPAASDGMTAPGTSCLGSSEACMLGGLALKRRWQAARRAAGKPTDKPNMVFGTHVQVCWEKFCNYFEVEPRRIPVSADYPVMHPDPAIAAIDENTIGVAIMFGSTYNGQFEDVKQMNEKLEVLNQRKGFDVWIHVDAASGAFVAPFIYPDLEWDFRLSRVASINASGHKYGMVYPGIGWLVWRSHEHVPESMVFHINYLGGDQPSINMNFSRSAAMVVAQYYQFVRMGMEGYTLVMRNLMRVTHHCADLLFATGHFALLGPTMNMPVIAFRLTPRHEPDGKEVPRVYDECDVMSRLKEHGWMVPAYTLPEAASDVKMMRIVIREDFTLELAEELVNDFKQVIEWLDHHYTFDEEKMQELHRKFHHAHPDRKDKHKRQKGHAWPC